MKKKLLIFSISALILLGSGIGYFLSGNHDYVEHGSVLVRVNNQSGQTIKSVILTTHENEKIQVKNIPQGESVKLIFKSGESSYKIVATFENDSTLTSEELYLEGGYRTVETVYNDHIKSDYQPIY